jgi:hypothetical protein
VCRWPFRVHVGKGLFLSNWHTKRSPTHSDIYQTLYWYNWFSWWWARSCSKHVENWNKHIEKNCASSWSFTKNYHSSVFWSVMWCRRFKEPTAFTFGMLLLVHWVQRQEFVQNIGTYLYQSTWCHIAKALYLTALLLQNSQCIAVVKFPLLHIVNKFFMTLSCHI